MKKIVLTFGLISGLIISVLMGGSLLLANKIGSGHSMALGYTIMVAFPFNITIASLTFGTRYHWDTRAPRNYYTDWPPSTAQQITFEPTHEFVIANDSSANALFAIDHFSTVAWGIDPGGVLLGCILRNAPGSGNGASGYDEATHSVSYAIRLPNANLQSPTAGCSANGPLGEALAFNNPVLGVVVASSTTSQLPSSMSIASTNDPTGVITAAKIATANSAQWILRVYQPTNQSSNMQINIDPNIAASFLSGGNLNAAAASAMENAIDGSEFNIVSAPSSFTFTAPRALATFSLTPG